MSDIFFPGIFFWYIFFVTFCLFCSFWGEREYGGRKVTDGMWWLFSSPAGSFLPITHLLGWRFRPGPLFTISGALYRKRAICNSWRLQYGFPNMGGEEGAHPHSDFTSPPADHAGSTAHSKACPSLPAHLLSLSAESRHRLQVRCVAVSPWPFRTFWFILSPAGGSMQKIQPFHEMSQYFHVPCHVNWGPAGRPTFAMGPAKPLDHLATPTRRALRLLFRVVTLSFREFFLEPFFHDALGIHL